MSAASGTSATRATALGLPLSSDSSSASSSVYFEMRSPTRHTILLRSEAVIAGQGPDSKARRAARTAASISALSPSAARAIVAPFAGFLTSKVFSEAAGSHLPSISSFLAVATNCATGRDIWGSFITALIVDSPCGELGSQQRGLLRKRRAMAATARLEPRETQRTQQRAGSEPMRGSLSNTCNQLAQSRSVGRATACDIAVGL